MKKIKNILEFFSNSYSSTSEEEKENIIPKSFSDRKNKDKKVEELKDTIFSYKMTYYVRLFLASENNVIDEFQEMFNNGSEAFQEYLQQIGTKLENQKNSSEYIIDAQKESEVLKKFMGKLLCGNVRGLSRPVLYVVIELKLPPLEQNKILDEIRGLFKKGDLTPFLKATFYMNPEVKTDKKTIIFDLKTMKGISCNARKEMKNKGENGELGCDLKISYNKI